MTVNLSKMGIIMKRIKLPFILILLAGLGFAYRIFIALLVKQPVIYDQFEYINYAFKMLERPLFAEPARLYGYPLLIAPILKIFGINDPMPWIIIQSLIDIATAVLVYKIAANIFSGERWYIALISYILYLFNPFTAAYVGVLLSEIPSIFMVTCIVYLAILFLQKRKIGYLLLIAFISGFLPQVRPSFVFFTAGIMLLSGFWIIQAKNKIGVIFTTLGLMAAMYILPFSYTLASNYVNYGEVMPLTVDRVFWREVYLSNFIGRGIPFAANPEWDWPQEAYRVWWEYSMPTTKAGRVAMAAKYEKLSLMVISADIPKFVKLHLNKLWYVWEKHFIYPYYLGLDTPLIRLLVYWSNVILLVSGWLGLGLYIKNSYQSVNKKRLLIGWIVAILFMYISAVHVFSTSEERFSLPAYPLIAVFAGYIWGLFFQFKSMLKFKIKP
jgi:hypothetical protein